MSFVSSPLTYPASSSPPPMLEKRKRQHELDIPTQAKRKAFNAEHRCPTKAEPPTSASKNPDTLWLKSSPLDSPSLKSRGPFADDDDDDDNKEQEDNHEESMANSGTMHRSLERRTPRELNRVSTIESTLAKVDDIGQERPALQAKASSGKNFNLHMKEAHTQTPYEHTFAEHSKTVPGKATKSYYGIDVHKLLDDVAKDAKNEKRENGDTQHPSMKMPMPSNSSKRSRTMLWTEKYRARKFTDLVGDERTHRDVLRWLKGWDPIVFPGTSRFKSSSKLIETGTEPRQPRKLLLLAGPPGLGKTTLAHVCARQAGYEVVEINASDERSRDVVKGRIKECVGTENVKGINVKDGAGTTRKIGRPVCLVVDEVDGVTGGSNGGGGGEGGFVKALIDMVTLDQKNSNILRSTSGNFIKSGKKGSRFRLLRPMILICNDIYNPALRHLRASTLAEIIHIRRPPLDKVVARLKSVFDQEGIACEGDGVRRLCEATWGTSTRRDARTSIGTNEGDMRGILVVSEWVAAKMRASTEKNARLTKKWVEEHMLANLSHEGGGARGLGRGGPKEAVERVFLDGAGFPRAAVAAPYDACKAQNGDSLGVSELMKHTAMTRLRDVVDTCGESDRIVMDCFTAYPSCSFQDDTFLSKPNAAHEWLHFHDQLSSKMYGGQEWELGPYISQSVLAFHHLFASPARRSRADQKHWEDDDEAPLPFSGPGADYLASEASKQNKVVLLGLQSSLSSQLFRSFTSAEDIMTDLLPSLVRMLTPNVRAVTVGGGGDLRGVVSVRREKEREMIQRAVEVMAAVGVTLEQATVHAGQSGISSQIYRMEP